MAKRTKTENGNGNGSNLGFEEKLWLAADKLRGSLDAAEDKHVVLGLIFLKCISEALKSLYPLNNKRLGGFECLMTMPYT